MSQFTQILNAVAAGDTDAGRQLLPLVYDELRRLAAHKMATEREGHTLQPTALVHEAYVRLLRARRRSDGLGQPRTLLCGGGKCDAESLDRQRPAQGKPQARR